MINCFGHICTGCLNIGNGMCDMMFGDPTASDTLAVVMDKLIKATKLQSSGLARSGSGCDTGYVEDCADEDCCPEEWIGDGYADCADQVYGCDLTCYNDDGGDCEVGFGESVCVPSSPCFMPENQYQSSCLDLFDCSWVYNEFDGFSHCEPKPTFNPNACGGQLETDCNQDDACQWNTEPGPNDPNPSNFTPHCGPKAPDDCFVLNIEEDCNASSSCEWDAPDWIPEWQSGACFTFNPCGTPENSNPDTCDANSSCNFDWEYYECVESEAGDDFCACVVSHTQRSCNDINGSWKLPDWVEDCEDCYGVQPECFVPMESQDCYHEFYDPCAQFNQGGNEHTDWDDNTHTCVKSFSFSEAGDWALGVDCLELNWNEQPEPECTDDPLQAEETCYCFDCEWDYELGSCADWSNDGMGRTTEQAKMHDFQEMIYELSGSSDDGECLEYQLIDGKIQLMQTWDMDDDGTPDECQIIMLTPITPGS
jgi:hypothetical protein